MYSKNKQDELYHQTKKLLEGPVGRKDYDLLVDLLQYHEWKYYIENNPVISDFEYDTLYKRLEEIEKSHPDILRPDSPTQRVSSDLTPDFPSVRHLNPMLSLANSYNEDDLLDFDRQVRKLTGEEGDIEYFTEPKLDGGSIALIYKDDLLVRAATRGNGVEGEDITANARTISSVPLRAAFSKAGIYTAELRGEAVISLDAFARINEVREKEGLVLFANPRNAATGGLRMKDANETRKRGLEVFVFQLAYAADKDGNNILNRLESHSKSMELLAELGFKIPRDKEQKCRNIEEAIQASQQLESDREAYKYEIDGAVVKVNAYRLQEQCGATQHHPRWAIAFKFKAKQATTIMEAVEYQVGKTGAITPVAKVTPVHLAGVTVSSISLHNEDFINQKDLRIGDKIIIERAGDVIPYVVKSLEDLRSGREEKIEFPLNCPSCDSALEKSEEQAAWRCPNYTGCDAQILQRIIYHVSKDAMDIDGFGKSYVEKFYELGWIKDISDIYRLDYQKISELEGFGEKSAAKLQKAVEEAKRRPLQRLLVSLSIHHLGKKASKLIARHISNIFELKDWTMEDFTDIRDIGPVVAENVIGFFSMEENIEILEKMASYGVNVAQTEEDKPIIVEDSAPLKDKTILFTGSLKEMTRKEAQKAAEIAGARNISAVSSKLDILVVGENAGSKLKKAEALGTVQIFTEKEFIDLIQP